MPELDFKDAKIVYAKHGHGKISVVLTPGGRWGGYVMEVVAKQLAKDFTVITWDRRNADGGSSLYFGGDSSEADVWADDLARLIDALDVGPCYVGEYSGCRTTPILATKRPDLVRGVMLAWPSGGEVPSESVPRTIYRPYMRAALRGGMEAVASVEPFARSIHKNVANLERLRSVSTSNFVRQFGFWEAFFTTTGDFPTAGCRLSDDEWSRIAVPLSVTGGVDPVHPTAAAKRIHNLVKQSILHPPVVTEAEWGKRFGVLPYPEVADFQGERIAPVWRNFIKETER